GRDPGRHAVHSSRNFGQQTALQAGLDEATGRAVILMDADLQDPPEVLGRLVEHWRQGYEVVYAIRRRRKEGLVKRAAYAVFYRTLKAVAEIDVPLDAGDFCLLDRRVVDTLATLPERNRLLRGLRRWVGFRQVGVEYERDARHAGETKYTLRRLRRRGRVRRPGVRRGAEASSLRRALAHGDRRRGAPRPAALAGRQRIIVEVLRRELGGRAAHWIGSVGSGPAEGLSWVKAVGGAT